MRVEHDMSELSWQLSGWTPQLWRLQGTEEFGSAVNAEVSAVPAAVPGSVQQSLRSVGLLPDWNTGHNARLCEWVENRHWIYETALPDEWLTKDKECRLVCQGLDYGGWLLINGKEIASFRGSYIPHIFTLSGHLREHGNIIQIVFDTPPRWLGQFGYTSRIKEWKVRFNYMWDWTARLVQIGIWGRIYIEVTDGNKIRSLYCQTDVDMADSTGALKVSGQVDGPSADQVRVCLEQEGRNVRTEEVLSSVFNRTGVAWDRLPVDLWWPNRQGEQPLYQLTVELLDKNSLPLDRQERLVGFKHIDWKPCQDAPEGADSWLCCVNGKDIFLQGANWVPIRPNFADVSDADYRRYLTLYRDLGFNFLRVWGGAVLEKEVFYRLCDELGLMIWQEFPLSSSGVDDYPPDDPQSIEEVAAIAETYIARRHHHTCLFIWCGGNELITREGGGYRGVDETHPMIHRLRALVEKLDPRSRFLSTSPSGPTVHGVPGTFGKGLHWDVHGPWRPETDLEQWRQYWENDDALFRSELGACSASPEELIHKYVGELNPEPVDKANPFWKRPINWWVEVDQFIREHNRRPVNLGEYICWSQERQAQALCIAVQACRDRFPRCGGFCIWMGHDCFPCAANTAIIDFEGNPKPAALALSELMKQS